MQGQLPLAKELIETATLKGRPSKDGRASLFITCSAGKKRDSIRATL
jgi:hypothetical protein